MGAAVLAFALSGCGHRHDGLRSRAAVEMSCHESLRVEEIGAGGVRVTGCGLSRMYTCGGTVCVPTSGSEDSWGSSSSGSREREPSARRAARQWPDQVIRSMLRGIAPEVLACFTTEHTPATVRVVVGRAGLVTQHAVVSEVSPDEDRCLTGVLARVRLDGDGYAPRSVVLAFDQAPQEIGSAASPSAVGTEPSGAEPWDVEATVRAALDAQAPRILMCTLDQPALLMATWDASGALTVSLRGQFAGAPEEACVRHVLEDVSVSASGRSGVVLHPIERE